MLLQAAQAGQLRLVAPFIAAPRHGGPGLLVHTVAVVHQHIHLHGMALSAPKPGRHHGMGAVPRCEAVPEPA